jgi:hypothetical protein
VFQFSWCKATFRIRSWYTPYTNYSCGYVSKEIP